MAKRRKAGRRRTVKGGDAKAGGNRPGTKAAVKPAREGPAVAVAEAAPKLAGGIPPAARTSHADGIQALDKLAASAEALKRVAQDCRDRAARRFRAYSEAGKYRPPHDAPTEDTDERRLEWIEKFRKEQDELDLTGFVFRFEANFREDMERDPRIDRLGDLATALLDADFEFCCAVDYVGDIYRRKLGKAEDFENTDDRTCPVCGLPAATSHMLPNVMDGPDSGVYTCSNCGLAGQALQFRNGIEAVKPWTLPKLMRAVLQCQREDTGEPCEGDCGSCPDARADGSAPAADAPAPKVAGAKRDLEAWVCELRKLAGDCDVVTKQGHTVPGRFLDCFREVLDSEPRLARVAEIARDPECDTEFELARALRYLADAYERDLGRLPPGERERGHDGTCDVCQMKHIPCVRDYLTVGERQCLGSLCSSCLGNAESIGFRNDWTPSAEWPVARVVRAIHVCVRPDTGEPCEGLCEACPDNNDRNMEAAAAAYMAERDARAGSSVTEAKA